MDFDPGADPAHLAIARTSSDLASAIRALAHDQRLMILGLVAESELSVGEIERIMRIPQPAVSQQLARLREDDLVTVRREGRTAYYLTNAEAVGTVIAGLASLTRLAPVTDTGAPSPRVERVPPIRKATGAPASDAGSEAPVVSR